MSESVRASVRQKRPRVRLDAEAYAALRREVIERDGGRCRDCGEAGAEVHHVVFRSRGGNDSAANLVTLCLVCHGARHGIRVVRRCR